MVSLRWRVGIGRLLFTAFIVHELGNAQLCLGRTAHHGWMEYSHAKQVRTVESDLTCLGDPSHFMHTG